MKRLLLFGSTGSIGRNVLDIVAGNHDRFKVTLLSAHSNVELLAQQAIQFGVGAVHVFSSDHAEQLRQTLPDKVRVFSGPDCYAELVEGTPSEMVVNAVVGAAGLEVSYYSLRAGKTLALANKESLVAGGELLTRTMRSTGAEILPIDSEHSAIWQCLRAGRRSEVERIILTASGGPFRDRDRATFGDITVAEALRHPNWSMGQKITIDSATMMNKGLEVIEARFLFGLEPDQIDIVVHPESIIHSLVQFSDGAQIAQMSPPDMRLPIAYALNYPERLPTDLPRTDLAGLGKLTFARPDREAFPAIALAYKALETGGFAPLVLNAANEVAVESFLAGKIKFTDIPRVVGALLERTEEVNELSLSGLLAVDHSVRLATAKLVETGTLAQG